MLKAGGFAGEVNLNVQILTILTMVTAVALASALLLAALVVSTLLLVYSRRVKGWEEVARALATIKGDLAAAQAQNESTLDLVQTVTQRNRVRNSRRIKKEEEEEPLSNDELRAAIASGEIQ